MAYKFQRGAAKLSGSIQAEEGLVSTKVDATTADNVVASLGNADIPAAKIALADGRLLIGDAANKAVAQSISGDISINNAGAVTIQANAVEGSMINSNAAGDGLKYGSNALNIEPNDFAGTGLEDDGSDNLRLAAQGTGIAGGAGSTLSVAAAQTSITSVLNDSFTTIGRAGSADDVIDFSSAGSVIVKTNDVARLTVADASTTVGNNLVVTGDLTVNGTTTTVNSTTIAITSSFTFEGSTPDAHETILGVTDPTADATINLPAMSAGTYHVPVLAAASTVAISSTPAELNLLDAIARGSIIHGDSSGASALLAKGGANTVLSSDGTDIAYSAVTNAMLAGSIADSKLNTITTAGKVEATAIDLPGAADIGEALVDADLLIIDNGASGATRKSAMSRVKTYIENNASIAAEKIQFDFELITAGSTHSITKSVNLVGVSGSITVTLPDIDSTNNGQMYVVKDAGGNAGTNNIVINSHANVNDIDGFEFVTIESDSGAVNFLAVSSSTNGKFYSIF